MLQLRPNEKRIYKNQNCDAEAVDSLNLSTRDKFVFIEHGFDNEYKGKRTKNGEEIRYCVDGRSDQPVCIGFFKSGGLFIGLLEGVPVQNTQAVSYNKYEAPRALLVNDTFQMAGCKGYS